MGSRGSEHGKVICVPRLVLLGFQTPSPARGCVLHLGPALLCQIISPLLRWYRAFPFLPQLPPRLTGRAEGEEFSGETLHPVVAT